MGKIKQIYALVTCDDILVSYDPPAFPLDENTSYVEVIPNEAGTNIVSIIGKYKYGVDNNKEIEFQFNINFESLIITQGCNLLAKILAYESSIDSVKRDKILALATIGNKKKQRFINAFTIGLALVLGTYCVLSQDQCEVGYPFDPITVDLPSKLDSIVISKNLAKYVNFFGHTIGSIDCDSIGKVWLRHHVEYWKHFNEAFEEGPEYPIYNAAHKSILDFSNYLNNRLINSCSNDNVRYDVNLDTAKNAAIDILNKPDGHIKKKFEKALLVLVTLTSKSIETIEESTAKAIRKINKASLLHGDNQGCDIRGDGLEPYIDDTIVIINNTKRNVVDEIESSKSDSLTQIDIAKNDAINEIEDFKQFLNQFVHQTKDRLSDEIRLITEQNKTTIIDTTVDEAIQSINEAGTSIISSIESLRDEISNTSQNTTLISSLSYDTNVQNDINSIKKNLGSTILRIGKLEEQVLNLTDLVYKIAQSLRLKV